MRVIWSPSRQPANARVSFQNLSKHGVKVGDWAEIADDRGNKSYCRVWPADLPDDQVVADNFLRIEASNNNVTDAPSSKVVPVRVYQIALEATLTVSIKKGISEEAQKRDLAFVFEDGTAHMKQECIKQFCEGILVRPGSILASQNPFSVLQARVLSTQPDNTPVLITRATRLTLLCTNYEKEDTVDQNQSIDGLMRSIETLSLSLPKTEKPTGLEKAYDALYQVVSYPFMYKEHIEKLGIECPKGILLYGPPGVGKTFLVSSVARACGAQLFILQGSEIYGPYIGESEEKLRIKFRQAQEAAARKDIPVILFIDEIDALTPHREKAQSHENRVVAQLLTLMDGMQSRGRLIIVAATNRPNAIDPALRRPGRFDREISIDAPDFQTRKALFTASLQSIPIDRKSVNEDMLASATNGYVAADIAAVCREAAMQALRRSISSLENVSVCLEDFKKAFSAVGPSMQRGFQVQVDKTNWGDVGGLETVKRQLKQAVEWPIVHKESFSRLGLKPPRGILLYGPPGCSKTTLVKVIASTSGAAFLSINGAQLYSPFVGDSEKTIRTTFQKARASAPAIIFLDETEAIVGKRNMGSGGSSSGDSVQERVLSTLLNEMDGVETAGSVLIVGATNRPDMLDAALLRPGRFDRLVYVPPPDEKARLEILKIHTRHMPLADDVDLENIASKTEMYTGADLQNVCREAAMMALRRMHGADYVTRENFDASLTTIPPSLTIESVNMYKNTVQHTY
ncbi:hypothetical protein VTP01DRAFT_456 [Rhizomucor pusillus]|uniref:uncharacterized protein n=1 Tax=Rhizomucor pusillus TaxID=4840 RepID=UPI0037438B9A